MFWSLLSTTQKLSFISQKHLILKLSSTGKWNNANYGIVLLDTLCKVLQIAVYAGWYSKGN
jgi:hypothetical protein